MHGGRPPTHLPTPVLSFRLRANPVRANVPGNRGCSISTGPAASPLRGRSTIRLWPLVHGNLQKGRSDSEQPAPGDDSCSQWVVGASAPRIRIPPREVVVPNPTLETSGRAARPLEEGAVVEVNVAISA